MELGNESDYTETNSKIKWTASEPAVDGEFEQLTNEWIAAMNNLKKYQRQEEKQKNRAEALQKVVQESRLAMDSWNRYSISVRGTSPHVYGILREAGIVIEFAT